MDTQYCNTAARKGQHLLLEERCIIAAGIKCGENIYQIAKELNRSYNTIKAEIQRGTVHLKNGRAVYKADVGQAVYQEHRKGSGRPCKFLQVLPFLKQVEQSCLVGKMSLDSFFGRALVDKTFSRDEMVCTKTLYNYVDKGLLRMKNLDLPEKVARNTKEERVHTNKRGLGDSIEQRPKSVDDRQEFGHWEADTVVGSKAEKEPCVATLVERKTRDCIWVKAENHTAEAVQAAIDSVIASFGEKASLVFKTVTADNGSEFAKLTELAKYGTKVYFTHPYSSWEKGTNECHNRMLRRFIPKGKSMTQYSSDDIAYMADWVNSLPRKILHYRTPEELFDDELDLIYAC